RRDGRAGSGVFTLPRRPPGGARDPHGRAPPPQLTAFGRSEYSPAQPSLGHGSYSVMSFVSRANCCKAICVAAALALSVAASAREFRVAHTPAGDYPTVPALPYLAPLVEQQAGG